jgi:hypothetical protein
LYGKTEVVAPISAPMLQIVAIPVQEMESTPGPKYSTIAPVPPRDQRHKGNSYDKQMKNYLNKCLPLTVRMPATLRITSLGDVQPCNFPVNLTPIT